ncbi:MAG: type I-C CRISPR-associated protein Cas8c/Csd1 [Lentisphaerae bacterium]|nr:type I-C CRISPR-associated protein Cas8c/Csd1 [Lentisphaerota bacterium]
MSWIEKLYKTYENNINSIGCGDVPLLPVCHTTQKAQVQIILDIEGEFLRASVVTKTDARTIIPCTEASSGRTSGVTPHPLCDKLQYVAADYTAFGGEKDACFDKYSTLLNSWRRADSTNSKLRAIAEYVMKKRVIADLVNAGILHVDARKQLINQWNSETSTAPELFYLLPGGTDSKGKSKPWQADAFLRWRVECPRDPQSDVWNDRILWQSWITYCGNQSNTKGLCYVTGQTSSLADQHPAKLRNDGDKAKLISSNDSSGFTFRGRFLKAEEACGVGIDVTQKSHNALRWLIARQGRRDGDQAIVAWAVSGVDVPDPIADTFSMLFKGHEETVKRESEYTAQEIGEALKELIGGYSAKIGATEDVLIMGLDSATPGRMAVSFYRELTGSEFLQRVMAWHDLNNGCVWRQYFGKDRIFVGAPAPRDIAECAYGRRLDEKLRKATIERLLPCIVDGTPIPRDLVESCVRRARNRSGLDHWEFEKALGIACALYRHHNKERNYTMTLAADRKTRDYLYGRLLAAADSLESLALWLANEKRPTNAARMMQRFADHPCSTWRTIELSLAPYKARLGGRAHKQLACIDEIMAAFNADEFVADTPLTGEFLLGYHAQRAALRADSANDVQTSDDTNEQETIPQTAEQE